MWIPPPDATILRLDENGDLRVGSTRMLVDLIVHAHHEGWAADHIADVYSSLTPDDVARVIRCYEQYRTEIDAYMVERERLGGEMQRLIEANQPSKEAFFQVLLERRRAMEASHAAHR